MLKGYSEYKDVESNWINKIPIAWSFLPLQSQMKERKEKNDKKQTAKPINNKTKDFCLLFSTPLLKSLYITKVPNSPIR